MRLQSKTMFKGALYLRFCFKWRFHKKGESYLKPIAIDILILFRGSGVFTPTIST